MSEPAVGLEGIQWTLVELDGEALALTEGESPPYLLLNAEESRVSGPGGCNRLVGSFEVSEDGLRLGPIAATRMACPEAVMRREDAFLRTLEATTRYELDARR